MTPRQLGRFVAAYMAGLSAVRVAAELRQSKHKAFWRAYRAARRRAAKLQRRASA